MLTQKREISWDPTLNKESQAINNLRLEGLTVLKNQLLICYPVPSGHP